MRFYRIEISGETSVDVGEDENDQPIIFKNLAWKPSYVYSSHSENGQMNPGALNVIFNLSLTYFHSSANVGSFVQIQGLPLKFLSQAYDLRGKQIRIFGGMTKGYMVDKDNVGLLLNGVIVAPHGDWEGTNQTLSFYLINSALADQKFINMHWGKGQLLSDALKSALTTAFPKKQINISIKPRNDVKALKMQGAQGNTLETFSSALYQQKDVYKTDPINIYSHNDTIFVTDRSNGKKIQLETKYMIGQPTWSDNGNITVKMMLRPDININDIVVFPRESSLFGAITPSNTTADYFFNRGTNADIKKKPIFQGEYFVTAVQHVGHYKSPSPQEWITFLTLATINVNDNVNVEDEFPIIESGYVY